MKRRRVDNRIERQIATALIVSTEYCKEVSQFFDASFIEIPFARMVSQWAMDYYTTYDEAPKKEIENLFTDWERKHEDQSDLVELIRDFLEDISAEYTRTTFNWEHVLDRTKEQFRRQSLLQLSDEIKSCVHDNATLDAEQAVANFRRVESLSSDHVQPIQDTERVSEVFERPPEPLFTFADGLGTLLNPALTRGGFVGVMGPEKVGKTWWLIELTHMAIKARCDVAFFAVGDMSTKEMTLRHQIRLAGKSNLKAYSGKQVVPCFDCKLNQTNTCRLKIRESKIGVEFTEEQIEGIDKGGAFFELVRDKYDKDDYPETYRPCVACLVRDGMERNFKPSVWFEVEDLGEPLDAHEAVARSEKFATSRMPGREYRLMSFPSGTLNAEDVDRYLDIWEQNDGWIPDVIVIDYADVMGPEPDTANSTDRERENKRWKRLRRISQERNCLVIVATQSDAKSYSVKTQSRANFSEDKRKLAHVTAMIGLNQTDDEKEAGMIRLNFVVFRHGEFHARRTATVLQHLQTGRVHLESVS